MTQRSPADARRTVRVMAVDQHAVFRDAARGVVAAADGFTHVGDAASARTAVGLASTLRPDLVLIDARLPDGAATARAIAAELPDAVIVVCSVEGPDADPSPGDDVAAHVRKQDLSPAVLARLWAEHGARG